MCLQKLTWHQSCTHATFSPIQLCPNAKRTGACIVTVYGDPHESLPGCCWVCSANYSTRAVLLVSSGSGSALRDGMFIEEADVGVVKDEDCAPTPQIQKLDSKSKGGGCQGGGDDKLYSGVFTAGETMAWEWDDILCTDWKGDFDLDFELKGYE